MPRELPLLLRLKLLHRAVVAEELRFFFFLLLLLCSSEHSDVIHCRYLKCDLDTFDLRDLECKFDVILIEPPLEEYQRTLGVTYDRYWSWDAVSCHNTILLSKACSLTDSMTMVQWCSNNVYDL